MRQGLACALGNQACRQGYSVRYLRVPRLFEQLRIAHGDGSYARLMGQLQKTDLLILDDRGMQKMTAPQCQDLMEVIEDRHGRGSTLIASQSCPSSTGMTTSAPRRWLMPSWTGCCTAPTA